MRCPTNVVSRPTDRPLARAAAHFAAGRYAEAAGAYRAVLSIDAADYRAHLALAQCDIVRGRDAEAIEALTEAARAYSDRGAHEAAFALFGRALTIDPGLLELHIDIAELEEATGHLDAARTRLVNLVEAFMDDGRDDEAAALIEYLEAQGAPQVEMPTGPQSETVMCATVLLRPDGSLLVTPEPAPAPEPEPTVRTGNTHVSPYPPPPSKPRFEEVVPSEALFAATARLVVPSPALTKRSATSKQPAAAKRPAAFKQPAVQPATRGSATAPKPKRRTKTKTAAVKTTKTPLRVKAAPRPAKSRSTVRAEALAKATAPKRVKPRETAAIAAAAAKPRPSALASSGPRPRPAPVVAKAQGKKIRGKVPAPPIGRGVPAKTIARIVPARKPASAPPPEVSRKPSLAARLRQKSGVFKAAPVPKRRRRSPDEFEDEATSLWCPDDIVLEA